MIEIYKKDIKITFGCYLKLTRIIFRNYIIVVGFSGGSGAVTVTFVVTG